MHPGIDRQLLERQPGVLQLTSSSFVVNEGDGVAVITASRSAGSSGAVSATLMTADGTATAGSDYQATSTVLSWNDGESGEKSVEIPLLDDDLSEADETVELTLSDPTGSAILGLAAATLTRLAGGSLTRAAIVGAVAAAVESQQLGNAVIGTADLRRGLYRLCQSRPAYAAKDSVTTVSQTGDQLHLAHA